MSEASTLLSMLRARLGPRLLQGTTLDQSGAVLAEVPRAELRDAASFVHSGLDARFVISVGTDCRPAGDGFRVDHVFSQDRRKTWILLRAYAPADDPSVPSITPLVPAAGWAEREFQDLLGIRAEGHPDPRRLVLPDDWPEALHPLRRDVPYDVHPEPASGTAPPLAAPPDGAMAVPIGPFFPVLEEPVFIKVFADGEEVVGLDYRGFFNHRGIEKLGDSKLTYNEVPFVAERICGICGFVHSTAYVQALENAAGIEAPLRARYIRSIVLELERIHSHLLWLGIAGHILGFDTVLMQAWRIREPVMWLMERMTGNRKSYGMNLVGGVRRDVPKGEHAEILRVLERVEKEWRKVVEAVLEDATLLMRLSKVGVLSTLTARELGSVGPTARGSNRPIDVRIDHPYAAYDRIEVKGVWKESCDAAGRTLVRLEEALESIRQVRQLLAEMPDGPLMHVFDEALPPGREGVSAVEAGRGEVIHYVMTGEDARPYRWRVRAPTYANLQALSASLQGMSIADVPITLGSMDPCFSCTERMQVLDVRSGDVRVYSPGELKQMARAAGRGRGRR
ncbi:MAG: NADH-ubiquinone oxidoreductase [Acidobacteria bacterium]|nr:NADH-ubiquinone oxidoreductase [Acidobacteriota bacterium]